MRSRTELQEAFARTDYCVDYAGETFTLNVGCQTPDRIVDWIAHHNGGAAAWLITAHNPGGEIAADPDNRARTALLDRLLDRPGLECLAAVNRATSGHWPEEPGWLVAGLAESQARSMARRFGQAAIVSIDYRRVDLLWIRA